MAGYVVTLRMALNQAQKLGFSFGTKMPANQDEWEDHLRRAILNNSVLFEASRELRGIEDILQDNEMLDPASDSVLMVKAAIRRLQGVLAELEADEDE